MNYIVKTTINASPAAAITATTNGAQFVLPNGQGNVEVLIQTSAVTGTTPSLTPKLQVSQDGTNWFDAVTGTALTAAGTQRIACQSLAAYGRLVYTVSGTTPSFTVAATVLAN
jgi:hypothetical protein